jgi:hypothetical protein
MSEVVNVLLSKFEELAAAPLRLAEAKAVSVSVRKAQLSRSSGDHLSGCGAILSPFPRTRSGSTARGTPAT